MAHVFPYDPRHLGQDFQLWAEAQAQRWPLAPVQRSALAARSSVHVIGPQARRARAGSLEVVEHRALMCGPRYRDWGDDWSLGLERTLGDLGADDACVIHLNDYPAARMAQRAAWRSRVVLVFHGRGIGRVDDHVDGAHGLVVLRREARDELCAGGADPARISVLVPSVDRSLFRPADHVAEQGPIRLGFVGRLERSKGVLEVPAVLRALSDAGFDAGAELAGAFTARQRADLDAEAERREVLGRLELLGELPAERLASRMRQWQLLLMPSYTEGYSIVAQEACASRVPVAAVSGVLPAELESRPGVHAARRERYPELVVEMVQSGGRAPEAGWVPGHDEGAAAWDALLERLPPWAPRRRPVVSRLRRARRLRPPRRLARRVLKRRSQPSG